MTMRGKSQTSLSRLHVWSMHSKFGAVKVTAFVVSDFCIVRDFDCPRSCITPLEETAILGLGDEPVKELNGLAQSLIEFHTGIRWR